MIESIVPADDVELGAWFERRGFAVAGESWSGWQAAADRPAVAALPTGYQLVDRAVRGVDAAPEHPMVARNGPEVEARLRQTTLYGPRLDLAVLDPTGPSPGTRCSGTTRSPTSGWSSRFGSRTSTPAAGSGTR